MLKYFQWLAIAGVWWPLLVVAAWFGLAWGTSLVGGGSSGWGLVAVGMFLLFAVAHALAIASFVVVCLLATRRAPRVLATSASAILGGGIAILVLGRIY